MAVLWLKLKQVFTVPAEEWRIPHDHNCSMSVPMVYPTYGVDEDSLTLHTIIEFDPLDENNIDNDFDDKEVNEDDFDEYMDPNTNLPKAACDGNVVLLREKLTSVLHHIANQHKPSNTLFRQCGHNRIPSSEAKNICWLKVGSPANLALEEPFLSTKPLKDLAKLTDFCHTGKIEAYHSMMLKYCSKEEQFAYKGVIDLLGGGGGLVEYKASLLASHGFATLALAYIGYEDQPLSPSSINLDYFQEAANWLVSHPKVLPHGIGMHTICYGSWIALLMARYQIAAIKAIVAISPLVIAYLHPFQFKGRVSNVIPPNNSRVLSSEKGSIWRFALSTDLGYMNPTVSKYSAITPVENINCPVMLISGTDDLNIPAEFAVNLIVDRLKENGKEHLCINLRYPQAGHLIEPPYSPLCDSSFYKPFKELGGDSYAAWGGETGAHAWAQEDSWPKILHFLRKHLRQNTESEYREGTCTD
ncbi:Acyl-coenzyme A amino acid N-acyltransferase 2 [Stylophora pistillata]|uniref:Acyl-coenzyme A amino acid N-acyltransferase 2 n=1 Tax=Stylophora pistillata TaxID=50429 RepID=A0A2B4SRH5_STYPI|nr:Acyl-coenzyme A amino acid N-acyltransferase 2 [Stylophora pistillata]